jgi:WD40 repeat protein
MKQRYEYSSIRSQLLPGKRFVIIAGANNLKKGTLDIIDAGHGNLQWSLPIQVGFVHFRVPRNGNDFVIIGTGTNRQIREISTGNLISEIAERGRSSGRVVLKGKYMLFAELQNDQRYDNAIEIRKIDDGMLVDKIPVSGYIEDINISNDRNLLFAALDNESVKDGVRVWGTNNWSEIRFIEMDSIPKKLIPLANSDLLAVQDHLGTLRVWRISTGKEEHHFSHTLTAEGTQAASASKRVVTWQGASLRVWDTDTGKEIARRLSHGDISSLAFSPNGRMVAYLSRNKKTSKRGGDFQPLVIWEPDSHDEPIVLPMQFPSKVLVSPLGRRLVVIHRNNTVQIIDAATLRTMANIRPLADSKVNNVTFSNDGDLLFIREYKNQKSSLRVFSFDPLQEITRVDDSVLTESAPESQNVMTRNAKGDWRSWKPKDSDSHKLLLEIPTHSSHRLSPIKNTEYLLSYKTGAGVELLDIIQQTSKTVFPAAEGQFLRRVAISKEGKHVAVALSSGKDTGQVVIHKLDGGKELARLSTGISISAMTFANGGSAIVMSDTPGIGKDSNKSALWLWQWHQEDLQKLSHDNPVNAIHASPTGLIFATAEGAKNFETNETLGVPQVRIWNSQTGKEIQRISQASPVHDVAFSRDGQFLAVKLTRKVLVYQTQDWTQIQHFDLVSDQEKRIFNLVGGKLAFGIDNRLLVMGQSHAIRIWSLDGKEQRILRHKKEYPGFKLSANGRWLVTEDKQALRIWDVLTGKEHSHVNISVNSYAFFGREGDTLVANVNGQLMRIHWKSDDFISEACRRFRRNMTKEEWGISFDQEPYKETCDSKAQTFN